MPNLLPTLHYPPVHSLCGVAALGFTVAGTLALDFAQCQTNDDCAGYEDLLACSDAMVLIIDANIRCQQWCLTEDC